MGIKSIIAGCLTMLVGCGVAMADEASQQSKSQPIEGIATFTSGGVNLRQGPGTDYPYLCYLQGEELYFDAANIVWSSELGTMRIGGQIIHPDHEKLQGMEGETLPVLGREGDWVKMSYYGNDVWTMKKFLDIKPLVEPTTSTTAGSDYNKFSLTGDTDGSSAVFFQEAGMDEDEGLYFGHKQGNKVVFDHFLPVMMRYDDNVKALEVSKDPDSGILVFTYGPGQKLASFTDWNVIDVKGFSADNINQLSTLATKQDPLVFVTTGKDYFLMSE